MARLLITGASGLLGANLVLAAARAHQVVAACHDYPIRPDGVEVVQADLGQPQAARRLVGAARPEWVVHCAAASDVDACEADPAMAERLNADCAGWMAEACRAVGARLVHVSTDAVFDGLRGGYREEDTPAPINAYGRSKLGGEQAVAAVLPEALIVRTNFYGWNAQPKSSLAEWFLKRLEHGLPCPGWTDVFATPILANDLATLVLRLLAGGFHGIYHVAGSECASKYEFGVRLARVFELDEGLIQAASVEEAELKAARPRQLGLKVDKVSRALGAPPPGLEAGLRAFRRLRSNGYRDALLAMGQDAGLPSQA